MERYDAYPGILNELTGNELSSFVSESAKTSKFPKVYSVSNSTFFSKGF